MKSLYALILTKFHLVNYNFTLNTITCNVQLEQNAYFCSSIVVKIYIIKVGERTWVLYNNCFYYDCVMARAAS